MFFMEHMDRENALIVSIKTISEILNGVNRLFTDKLKFSKRKI